MLEQHTGPCIFRMLHSWWYLNIDQYQCVIFSAIIFPAGFTASREQLLQLNFKNLQEKCPMHNIITCDSNIAQQLVNLPCPMHNIPKNV